MNRHDQEVPFRARVPADVERPDKVIFGLTLRQLLILTVTGLTLYSAWSATATLVNPLAFAVAAVPVAAAAFFLAVGRRDGIALDAWLLAALRHRRSPHRLVPADGPVTPAPAWVATSSGPGNRQPLPAPLRLPARGITEQGLVDLGPDGCAAVVTASTVNFGLRTPGEQNGLVAGFARWLNSLDAPVQILIRAQRVDLSTLADRILDRAPTLPHPALEQAALAHAAFLDQLATERELLHRHVTVTVRDGRGPAHAQHRAAEAARALAACEVDAQVCDGPTAAATLAACLTPDASAAGGDYR
jgi:PrgI family protein